MAAAAFALPAAAGAAKPKLTFGSPLSVAATKDTAQNLAYAGTDIPTISGGKGVVVHVNHDGADTTLWNATLKHGSAGAPRAARVATVKLEGCARPASGAPTTLTVIHFEDLEPVGGGVHVRQVSEPFAIPVCGAGGASGHTVSTYRPGNLSVARGDIVGLAESGGFDPTYYPSGVPYQVIGAVAGSTMDSFIHPSGPDMSPSQSTNHDGFARNRGEELLLQATLAAPRRHH